MISRGRLGIFSFIYFCVLCFVIYLLNSRSPVTVDKPTFNPDSFYPCIAILIEFRSDPLILTITLNVLNNIPSDWPIQIFHGRNNSEFIRNSRLSKYITTNRIFLHQLDPMSDQDHGYVTSGLLTNITFWKTIKGEKVLLFQLDSVFCSNSPHKITDFLQYDYVGAPWHPKWKIPATVGNGGFSLRSRSKTMALLNIQTYNRSAPYHEDIWYSRSLSLVNAIIAPEEIAKTFSVETTFYETPLAAHKPLYLDSGQLKTLCQACPDLRLVVSDCD